MADTNHEIKVLPTGISDWDDIRYYDMFFVDKTEKLKSLVKIKRKSPTPYGQIHPMLNVSRAVQKWCY